uniref:Uncharacterized protein n=1 Tax=Gayliella sp. TaxID=2575623 RepID=A0A4D6WYW4_9FLOR|nr:hypothetical protein [Gayliella sp.]
MQDTNYYARLKYLLISLESLSLYETTSNIYYRHKQTILLQNLIDNKYINQNENTLKNHLINTIKSIYYIYNHTNKQQVNSIITQVLQNQELLNQYVSKFCNIYYKNFYYYTLNIFDAKYIAYLSLYTIHKITQHSNILYLVYYLLI